MPSSLKEKIPVFIALAVLIAGCSLLILERDALKTGFAVSEVEVSDVPPTKPVLVSPENNSVIYELNSTLSFQWINSVDYNNDPVSYNFMLATDMNFTAVAENASRINETPERTNYTPSITYVHSDYYWQVRGTDNTSYGNWSEFFKFRYCVGNNAPAIAPIGAITLYEGDSFYYRVIAADSDSDIITFSDNTPLFEINSTSGIIDFKTIEIGTFVITIVADDLCNATHEIFVLNVLSKSLRPPRNATTESGGGGAAPAPQPPVKKNETKNETEVTELTPEELSRFNRAQIIYIGNFKDQSLFNVTMYEGPIWFFTYEGSNYFLTLTPLSGESMFIGFFEGPGFTFRKPADILADINKNGLPEIKIGYVNRTGGNYSIVLEALKKPERQFPKKIMDASILAGWLLLAAAIIFLTTMLGKKIIRDGAKMRDPLEIHREISREKAGLFKVQIFAKNVGLASLCNLLIEEPLIPGAQMDGEIEVEKDASTELEKSLESESIKIKIPEFTKNREIRLTYLLKQIRKPEIEMGSAAYQIKILDTSVDFSKRYR
jgi:hypothetical protein